MAIGGSFAFTKILMGYFGRLPQEYTRHEGHPVILAEQSFSRTRAKGIPCLLQAILPSYTLCDTFITFWHTEHMD